MIVKINTIPMCKLDIANNLSLSYKVQYNIESGSESMFYLACSLHLRLNIFDLIRLRDDTEDTFGRKKKQLKSLQNFNRYRFK